MTSRWIKQRNGFGCGPVAIINLLKWLGEPVSYEASYPYWKKKCSCSEHGTPLRSFVNCLYSLDGIKIMPRSFPSVGLIGEAVSNGRAVVMKSAYKEGHSLTGHYFLVTDQTDKSFFCVNLHRRHMWVPKAAFQFHWLQRHANYCHECGVAPYAWLVRKA